MADTKLEWKSAGSSEEFEQLLVALVMLSPDLGMAGAEVLLYSLLAIELCLNMLMVVWSMTRQE